MDGQILDRRGRRGCPSINDAALALISLRCPNLTRLKVRGCREISDLGVVSLFEGSPVMGKTSLVVVCRLSGHTIAFKNGSWVCLMSLILQLLSMKVHLEKLQVSDVGLMAVSKCPELENFHLVKAPDCSNDGISAIAEKEQLEPSRSEFREGKTYHGGRAFQNETLREKVQECLSESKEQKSSGEMKVAVH